MRNKNEIYNGFSIGFDEKNEVWYACVTEEGKEAEFDSHDNRVENVSLKKLKKTLDIVKRSKFERMPVFVQKRNYRYGGGEDKTYETQYTEATLTSIAPNGNAYTVVKGEKHGDKTNLGYSHESIILDTPENRKIIAEIEKAGEAEWRAEVEQKKLKKSLKFVDEKKIYKEVYGKDL